MSRVSRRRLAAFTLVEVLVVIGIIGVLVGILLPAVNAARESARRSACNNNVKQLALALLQYENINSQLPAANDRGFGDRGYSWIVRILPHMEEASLFDSMASNSSNWTNAPSATVNNTLATRVLEPVICPSYRGSRNRATMPGTTVTTAGVTNYKGNTGVAYCDISNSRASGCCYDGPGDRLGGVIQMEIDPGYYYDKTGPTYNGVSLNMIKDGTSNTIMLAETKEPTHASWIGGNTSSITAVWGTATNANGVTTLTSGTTSSVEHILLIQAPSKGISAQRYYTSSAHVFASGVGSDHTGGAVMHAYADARVTEIMPDVDQAVMLAIHSRAGRETVDKP